MISMYSSQPSTKYITNNELNKKTSDSEHLFLLASSEIKDQFTDQTGSFYADIERDGHREILNMDYQEFDLYLSNIFFRSEDKVLSKDTSNNTKRLLKSFTKEKRTLYNRVAKISDTLYYDLCNEHWKCVKITMDGSEIVQHQGIFRRISHDRSQVFPLWAGNTRYLKEEIFDKSTIKNDYQKLIAEAYVISLLISDIALPMIIPIGPKGSGKSLLLRLIALIVDPREKVEALVQRLPRDRKIDVLTSSIIISHILITKRRSIAMKWMNYAHGLLDIPGLSEYCIALTKVERPLARGQLA